MLLQCRMKTSVISHAMKQYDRGENVYFRKSILKSLKICRLMKKITEKIAVE